MMLGLSLSLWLRAAAASSGGGGGSNSLDFSAADNSQYLAFLLEDF